MLFTVAMPPSNRNNARFVSAAGQAFVLPYHRHPTSNQQDARVAVSVQPPQSLNVGDRILMTEQGLQLVTKEGLRFNMNNGMPMQTGRFPSFQQRLSAPTCMVQQQQGSTSMMTPTITRKPIISPSSSSSSFERDFSQTFHRQLIQEHLKRSNETRSPSNLITSTTRPFPHLVSRSPSPVAADVSEAAMEQRANPLLSKKMVFAQHQHHLPSQTPQRVRRPSPTNRSNKRNRPFRMAADSKRFFRKKNNKSATKKAAKKKALAVDSLLSLASEGAAAGGIKTSGVISHRIKKSSSTA